MNETVEALRTHADHIDNGSCEVAAKDAYHWADAMIAARKDDGDE